MRYLLILLLAGCATTRTDVLNSGDSTVKTFPDSQSVVAGCMARNAEEYSPGVTTSIRSLNASDLELIVAASSIAKTLAVVHLEPHGTGSRATAHITPEMLFNRDAFRANILKGC